MNTTKTSAAIAVSSPDFVSCNQ